MKKTSYKVRANDGPGKVWYLVFHKRLGHIVMEGKYIDEYDPKIATVIKRLSHRDEISHKDLFRLDDARAAIE